MIPLGWSYGGAEPIPPVGDPWPFTLYLEQPEWYEPRGEIDAARSGYSVARLMTRGNPTPAECWHRAMRFAARSDLQAIGEPNVPEVEGWQGGENEWTRWCVDLIENYGDAAQWMCPPISPGHGHEEVRRWLRKVAHLRWRALTAHVYGGADAMWADLAVVLDIARSAGLPVVIGECSVQAGGDPLAWGEHELGPFLARVNAEASADVLGIGVFAPEWPRPDPGFQPLALRGTIVEATMRQLVSIPYKLLAPSAWAGGFHQPVAPITTSITWPTPATTASNWGSNPLPDDRRGDPITEALDFLWDKTLGKPEAEAVEMQEHIKALKRGLGLE